MPFRPIDSRIPHTVRTEDPNVLDVQDLIDDEESWLEEMEAIDREEEMAGVETPGTADLSEED